LRHGSDGGRRQGRRPLRARSGEGGQRDRTNQSWKRSDAEAHVTRFGIDVRATARRRAHDPGNAV
jgi:hypothetical protein